jgi:Putative auto-transporter adhesin, head GIN domain
MNKKSILLISALSLLIFATSCKKRITGEGPSVTETRTLTDFNKISLNVSALLYVTQDPGYKFTIDGQQNILDLIRTTVSGEELSIWFDNGKNLGSHDKIIIRVSAPLFTALNISGSGDISGTNALQTPALKLNLSGSGSILLLETAVTGALDATISGSGNIQVNAGSADHGLLQISGSGSIEALGVIFENTEAHISGSGNIKATVNDQLEAHISGSGSVYYKGTPAVNTHISGSGSVRKVQ